MIIKSTASYEEKDLTGYIECYKCGDLFPYDGIRLCPECRHENEETIDRIREQQKMAEE